MARQRISEMTNENLRKRHWDKLYRPKREKAGPLTDGREIAWGIVRLSVGTDENDLDDLETAIKAIDGIDNCSLAVSGQVPSANDIPTGYEVHATVEGRFILVQNPPVE